jgi:glycosyltransferase involved in cell wall biosynthesis
VTGITVGVPVYRGALTLPETLRSIQQQDHSPELVLVSIDGGDDESYSVVEPFLDDPRIRCVRQSQRLGWADHLSWLIAQCRTDFFVYWQQDDFASNNYLGELALVHSRTPDTSIAYTDVQWFGDRIARERMDPIIGASARDRVLAYADHQHWIPLRGLIRTDHLRSAPPCAALHARSPFENGFLAHLAGCAPMRRCDSALYFKRAHRSQWGSSFDRRPPETRRADWITRGEALLAVLEHFSDADELGDAVDRIVQRFAAPPPGRFVDHPFDGDGAPQRFVRESVALRPQPWEQRLRAWADVAGAPAAAELAAHRQRCTPISPGQAWSLAEGANPSGEVFLGFGWSIRERWGTWSEVSEPTILLPQVTEAGTLTLHGTHHGTEGHETRVVWSVDDGANGSQVVRCGVPLALSIPVAPGQRVLRLGLPGAVSPQELGSSPDPRNLGFGLAGLEFG